MSSVSKSNNMANRTSGPIKELTPSPSNLTVENVTKLELEYDSVDGDRRKVEDYIRKNQQLEELKRTTELSPPDTQEQELEKRGTNTTVDDLYGYGDSNEAQTQFPTKQCRKETSSKSEKKKMTNVRKFPCKNVQTQTECNELHVATITTAKNAEIPGPDDSGTKMSTSKAPEPSSEGSRGGNGSPKDEHPAKAQTHFGSVTGENTVESRTSDFECDGTNTFRQLFCCVKIQELFQYMIMETIESYTPEKTEEETEDEQTAALISDEMKALSELREQIQKTDTKEYITFLANQLSTHGSLFLMEKISFTLASANDTISNYAQSKDAFSDPAHNIDDYFIPVMDNQLIKKPKQTITQSYNSGQNFLILFPDGTGQVLYPTKQK